MLIGHQSPIPIMLKKNIELSQEEGIRILKVHVEAATNGLKLKTDNVAAEMLKKEDEMITEAYTKLYNEVWKSGIWPYAWTQSIIIPPQRREI